MCCALVRGVSYGSKLGIPCRTLELNSYSALIGMFSAVRRCVVLKVMQFVKENLLRRSGFGRLVCVTLLVSCCFSRGMASRLRLVDRVVLSCAFM